MKNKILTSSMLIFSLNACAQSNKIYKYFDLRRHEILVYNTGNLSVHAFEYIDEIKTCHESEKNICLKSEYITFSIPKNVSGEKKWNIDGTQYCVNQSIKNEDKSRTYIINFGYQNTCSEIMKLGYQMVFNTKYGLRYINGKSKDGFVINAISVGLLGIGGK